MRLSNDVLLELHERHRRGAALSELAATCDRKGWQLRAIFLRRGLAVRDGRALVKRVNNGRVCWPFNQPLPTTALRGEGLVPIDFAEYVRARKGEASAVVQQLYDTHGASACKPQRTSRGIVWRNRAFWWSRKGYYRTGMTTGPRRPLQHAVWAAHHGREVPRGHEVFFRDRDRHNFEIGNLELLTKAELHQRTMALGEIRSLSFEERSVIRGSWATTKSRKLTTLLLARSHPHANDTGTLHEIHARNKAGR